MNKNVKETSNSKYTGFIGILIAVFMIITAIFIFITLPLVYLLNRNSRKYKKEYKAYLRAIEGKKFFCYTNKKTTRHFVETQILPHLDNDINVIFLEGHKLNTEFNVSFLTHAVWGAKLPCLMKVENSEMKYEFIKVELGDAIHGRISTEDLQLALEERMESLK